MKKDRNSKILLGSGIFLGLMFIATLVSKGVYATQLPQVTCGKPKRMSITHEVSAMGSVKPSRELAANIDAGLRVKEVFVSIGDEVEEGQLLFTLDTEYIEELIAQKELEANKLELQIATLESNQKIAGLEKDREMERAGEDAIAAFAEANKQLERAQEDEAIARYELDQYVEDTPEDDSEEAWEIWEEGRRACENKVREAARITRDAQDALEAAYTQAYRNIEDSMTQQYSDATLGVDWMEFNHMKEQLEELRVYLQDNGEVYSGIAGVVTGIGVAAGQITTDQPVVTFADAGTPLRFEAILDQEQKKYVEPKAEGELSLGSYQAAGVKKIPVTVDYLTEIAGMPGSYTAGILLPENTGSIGQNGTFTLSVSSEIYSCCISLDALHQDENQRNFVYVLEETETILGKELVARKRMVNVLDQNDRYAALEAGVIDENDQIIESATKEFADGDVVRMKD